MSVELVHVEGDYGAGWMVPKPKAWGEMTEEEQLVRVLSVHNITCPGWCTEHYEGSRHQVRGALPIVHTWDLITDGPFTVGLEQRDWMSHPDGDLVQRDPAAVHIRLDMEPAIQAVLEMHTATPAELESWELDGEESTELASKLAVEQHDWAAVMAEALVALAGAIPQPRRPNGVEFVYTGRAW